MNLDELKPHVASAIRAQWPDFAAKHPHLSAAIEESQWVDIAAESIRDDPQFQAAVNNATALGTLLDHGATIVRNFVSRWLQRLG